MSSCFAIVDIFAGPGGLGEGFSSVRDDSGNPPFQIVLSIEKEKFAYETLLLRSFLRKFDNEFPREYYSFLGKDKQEPDWSSLYPKQWSAAESEVLHMEIGNQNSKDEIRRRISNIKKKFGDKTILIGGPPCQAYSVIGRVRNNAIKNYSLDNDKRHFLYKEYVNILKSLRPAVFVMENVRGILSTKVNGNRVFEEIIEDLKISSGGKGYELFTLSSPSFEETGSAIRQNTEFIVRAENFGVPQSRHRVFVVGIRRDFSRRGCNLQGPILTPQKEHCTVGQVLRNMPKLRSGISISNDDGNAWGDIILKAADKVEKALHSSPKINKIQSGEVLEKVKKVASRENKLQRSSKNKISFNFKCPSNLRDWFYDPLLKSLPNNETRTHMSGDLERYLFAITFASVVGHSPKASEFPSTLAPRHANWVSGKFSDRFRVQLWNRYSTTITSHISRDGHYYIHPDPTQCRSLTVREVARLQTFPDNYFFKGGRTQQYVQVGNAVPPYLAYQIAMSIWNILK